MTWTSWAVPGMLAGLVAWGAAIVLLRTSLGRSLNRRLAAVLFLEGLWLSGGIFFTVEDPRIFMIIAAIAMAAMAALPFQYLSFLGVAVETRLVAPFRSGIAFWTLALMSVAAGLSVLLVPGAFIGELYSPDWATWNFQFEPMGARAGLAHGIASLFGLVAALAAYRRAAPGTAARSRAKWFAIAFGVRDLFSALSFSLYPVVRPTPFWGDVLYNLGPPSINLIYVSLMAYGVLRAQLFDIDLKLKFALKQSTVGAVFTAAFFTGSELLEKVVPVEGTILGLLVAAAIVVILRPVQRFAERFANGVMRGVQDTPAYLQTRKHEVYRAALEGALEDGGISEKERAILGHLRRQLEISVEGADAMERGMVGELASGAFRAC